MRDRAIEGVGVHVGAPKRGREAARSGRGLSPAGQAPRTMSCHGAGVGIWMQQLLLSLEGLRRRACVRH